MFQFTYYFICCSCPYSLVCCNLHVFLYGLLVITNHYVFVIVGMAASQPNKPTMKGVEEKDGEGEMAGWLEKAVRKVREEDAAALEKKKQHEFEEKMKKKERGVFEEITRRKS